MDDIRMLIKIKNIPMWKIAKNIGISETTLYRWMRTPNVEHRQKIIDAIIKIDEAKTRADLMGALTMLKGRKDYHMKTGDPFGVTHDEAAMWAVEKALFEMIDEEKRDEVVSTSD